MSLYSSTLNFFMEARSRLNPYDPNAAQATPILPYGLWVVPSKSTTSWLLGIKSCIYFLDQTFGIHQEDILPREEKFLLIEGTTYFLVRLGMHLVCFEVPIHPSLTNCLNYDLGDIDEIMFS